MGSHFLNELHRRELEGLIKLTQCSKAHLQWSDISSVTKELNRLLSQTKNGQLDVIWALGKAGFASAYDEMLKEHFLLKSIMQVISAINHKSCCVHFMSSAGGLYEGQGTVNTLDQCMPISPYGIWKLKQEDLLNEFDVFRRIYRISTAYGVIINGQRVGLIAALLNSVVLNTKFICTGNKDTLRDYIYCKDVAAYIVTSMFSVRDNRIDILASGAAYSIQNVIDIICHITHKKINVEYQHTPDNYRDITFSKSLMPKDLTITPLIDGITAIVQSAHPNIEVNVSCLGASMK